MIYTFFTYIYQYILPTFLCLVGIRLLFNKKSLFSRFIGLYFLAFYIFLLLGWIIKFKLFAFWPHLIHVASPFHYLLGPFSYLFIFFGIKPYKKMRWVDYLHFIPFLLHVAELIPFYAWSSEKKELEFAFLFETKVIASTHLVSSHFLPIKFHLLLKICSVFSYYVASVYIALKFYLQSKSSYFKTKNLEFFSWLGVHFVIKGFVIGNLILIAFGFFQTMQYINVLLVLDFVLTSAFFLFYPQFQKGLHFESIKEELLGDTKNTPAPQVVSWKERKYEALNVYFETQVPFTDEKFNKIALADYLKISDRQLVQLINEKENKTFPDFVAIWRLNYIKKMMSINSDWENMSIELISEKSGFGSRQTLYRTVERMYKMTPNQFFKKNNDEKA